MTLIIAVATKRFVVLVADRRITTTKEGKLVSQDDTDTKSAFIDNHYIMGFTGLARIGPDQIKIDQWLTENALGGYQGEDFFEVLAQATGETLEEHNYAGYHAFLAVGFTEDLLPEIVLVSNYHMPDGAPYPSQFKYNFNVVRLPCEGDYLIQTVGGITPSVEERAYLERKTRRSIDAEAPGN